MYFRSKFYFVKSTEKSAVEKKKKKNAENSDVIPSSSTAVGGFSSHAKLIAKEEITFTNKLIGQGGYGTVQKARWYHTLVAECKNY